tara:strand:+ start:542 stop:1372 length:831 start_codon:yes stop_codon:yes gene_type:complete
MLKKKALVIIKGGLGNQLFQICTCNYLRAQGFDVYVDTSFFYNDESRKYNTKRDLEIPIENLNFKIANKLFVKLMHKLLKFKFLSTYQKGHKYNYKSLKYINIFDGYWQNTNNLEFSIDFIKNYLSIYPDFKLNLNKEKKQGSTLLHVRRKDYLNLSQELNLEYYRDAINLANNEIKDFNFDIFTDDIQWVKKNKLFESAKNVYGEHSFEGSSVKNFIQMIDYENFIISNSSYSFLAAYIGQSKNSKIYKPSPWFPNRQHDFDNFVNWIDINWEYS